MGTVRVCWRGSIGTRQCSLGGLLPRREGESPSCGSKRGSGPEAGKEAAVVQACFLRIRILPAISDQHTDWKGGFFFGGGGTVVN